MIERLAGPESMSQLHHPLRTPLNHIIGYSEILLEDEKDPEKIQALERIVSLARSASDAIASSAGGGTDAAALKHIQQFLISRTLAIQSQADALAIGNEQDVQRIRAEAAALLDVITSGFIPELRSEQPAAKVHLRGDIKLMDGRLLVVDDDATNRDLLERHLRKQGYYVETAGDGVSALRLLRKGSFDAVLLDLVMPEMGGLEVLDEVRKDPDLKQTPVLMISDADDLHSIANSIQRGAEDYLLKPFDTVLLDARLRATLERKRLRDHERTRNMELERLTIALQRSNEDLQRFAYAASHDLQAPVRTITTYLQLLQRRLGQKLTSDEAEMIGFAQGAARRMHELIQDLLSYSRATTAQLAMERVDCKELISTLLADMQVTLEETGARVTLGNLPVLIGDATGLRQLIQNLVTNAIKYRRPQEPSRVHISAEREDGFWVFSVRDNGQGIPPEYSKQIFLMFKRLHGDEIPGSGIGLAICQRIAERMGGRIWVDSEPNHGSTFFFTIPHVKIN